MSDTFKFTEVKLHSPLDNIAAALCIIQTHILASETKLDAEVMFGVGRFQRSDLEAAVALLCPLTGPLEKAKWTA
ncbi:hypothetical protein [Paenirhodobacter populi]|uniref:hypothetical protein n=1 Tax=Paenirhodobacter populi TaxID=2306993 RepID=UPI000FE396AF|nr:hypothetical protein [Sinirhodobacter populi]RWR03964.1 hypothetical protein D2T32_21235 [Sinirhodobacter populi]